VKFASSKFLGTITVISLALGACGTSEIYSREEFQLGVEREPQDSLDIVERMVVFHPLPSELPPSVLEALNQGKIVLTHDTSRDLDLTVIYRSGPYCGLPPDVDVSYNGALIVAVTSHVKGDCQDIIFTEAVGFVFAGNYGGDDVIVERRYLEY
jgi:hypothetical protein